MNKFLLFSLFIAIFFTFSSARPEPEIIAWNEMEEGIVENIRVPRAIDNFRKPFCMCITAENCPCRNGGNERGANIEGSINVRN